MVVVSTLRRHINLLDEKVLILALYDRRRQRRARRHRWWVHPIKRRRKAQGVYHNLVSELLQNEGKFYRYFRTTREQFTQILHFIEQDLLKTFKSREISKSARCSHEPIRMKIYINGKGRSSSEISFSPRNDSCTVSRAVTV